MTPADRTVPWTQPLISHVLLEPRAGAPQQAERARRESGREKKKKLLLVLLIFEQMMRNRATTHSNSDGKSCWRVSPFKQTTQK